jgi:tetratricopeptide (TPR) repeat protein
VPTFVPTVAPHSRRVPAMAAGLAGLAGLTVLGWWLFRPSAPQSTANAASPSAVVAGAGEHVGAVPSAAVAQGGEAATPDRPMLNARYAAAGMPQPSENCATRDHAAMAAIYAALGDLNGTKAQRRGAGDAGAVAALEGHKDAEALVLLSVALLGAGRDHVAVADAANRGLAACPQQALAHRVLGMVHLQGARWQVAADVFARAIALAPADAECHHRLGVAQLGLHAAADAATAFAAALALDPTLDDAAVGLGRARLAQRDHMGAMAALVTLARRTPPRADALFFLAAAEEANGDTEAARRDFCASAAAGYSHAELKCPSHKR